MPTAADSSRTLLSGQCKEQSAETLNDEHQEPQQHGANDARRCVLTVTTASRTQTQNR